MAKQVNHKCQVNGVTQSSTNRNLNRAQEEQCAPLLQAAECMKKAAADFDEKVTKVTETATELLGLLEGAPSDDPSVGSLRHQLENYTVPRRNKPLFGEPMTGGKVTSEQLNSLTSRAVSFDSEGGREGRKAALGKNTKNAIDKFKKTNYYKDNQEKFDPVFEKKKSKTKAYSVLEGPSLGNRGNSCVNNMRNALDELRKAATTDAGIGITQFKYEGKTAQEATDNAMDLINSTREGQTTINVTYDLEYREQCILLSQISALADYSYALDNTQISRDAADEGDEIKLRRRLPYLPKGTGNAPLVMDGESFGFINRLTQPTGMGSFDMTPAEIWLFSR